MFHKLQYISQGNSAAEHLKNIQEALDAGCLWIQLRMKFFAEEEIENTSFAVRLLCDQYHALFILNDNAIIAKNSHADGVHLGLNDMPVATAREIIGNDKLIGGSANTMSDVWQRIKENCDYIGLGPYRFTNTKEKLSPVLGLEGYGKIISQLSITDLKTPIYAIGGIHLNDVPNLMQTGVFGIAVSGNITQAQNKKQLINQFKNTLYATT